MRAVVRIANCALAIVALSACQAQEPPPHKRPPLEQLKDAKPTPVPGVPAISVAKAATVGAGPAFSADDARTFVQAHAVPGSLPKLSRIGAVESVAFLRADEASKLLDGEPIGGPPDRMVCVVAMTGDFAFPAPQNAIVRFPRAIEVFDAQSGNFLVSSGSPGPTAPSK